MSASKSWLQWFKSSGRPSSGRRTPSPARLGSRLCRLEPLEQRMVLSVISPVQGPFEIVSLADSAPAEVVITPDDTDPNSINLIGDGYDSMSDPLARVIGSNLGRAYWEYQQFIAQGGDPATFVPSNSAISLVDGRIAVGVVAMDPVVWEENVGEWNTVQMTDTAFLERLEAIGMEIGGIGHYTVGGWLAIDSLDELAQVDGVRFAQPEYGGTTNSEITDDHTVNLTSTDEYDSRSDPLATKLGHLARVYWEYQTFTAEGGKAADFAPSILQLFTIVDGRIAVRVVSADAVAWEEKTDWQDTVQATDSAFLKRLEAIGMEIAGMSSYTVGGWLPIDSLDDLAECLGSA